MLLTADTQDAGSALWRAGDNLFRLAADKGIVGQHRLAGGHALIDRDIRRLAFDLDLAKQRRAPRRIARTCDHRKDRLLQEFDAAFGEGRLVGGSG